MSLRAKEVARYLEAYISKYRDEYHRFIDIPPIGGGYPSLPISPYLYSNLIYCYITTNGVAIADYSREPSYQWHIAGGPAIIVDLPISKTPPEVAELLQQKNLLGKSIGIYRIVAQNGIPDPIWTGDLNNTKEEIEVSLGNGTRIIVKSYDLSWIELIKRLTFGAFGLILDIKLKNLSSDFWQPHVIRDLGFLTADRKNKRFFHYLELIPHVDHAAWDLRNIAVRVQVDIRRDYAHMFTSSGIKGGTISFGQLQTWTEPFIDRLTLLEKTIKQFQVLLDEYSDSDESVFHDFLRDNSILLDVYGEAISKPRFRYPIGQSTLNKEYVEPDFVIKYPGNSYKLVELEKPSKLIATKHGKPRHVVEQAAFQIAEWKAFILNHYDTLKDEYPGLSISQSTMLVMSRSTQKSFGEGRDIRKYMELVKVHFSIDEVFTYDDLLARANQAYIRLLSLQVQS